LKLQEAVELIRNNLEGAEIEVIRHIIGQDSEYFKLKVQLNNIILIVRERWAGGKLHLYGYQLLMNNEDILRYDNVPHHPGINTFPHHKHIRGHIEGLKNASLKAFLDEVKSFLPLFTS